MCQYKKYESLRYLNPMYAGVQGRGFLGVEALRVKRSGDWPTDWQVSVAVGLAVLESVGSK